MTTHDAFGRTLSTWLHEDAEHHVPEHLDDVLQRTAATRQRPAWSSLERWLPVNITLRRSLFSQPVQFGQIALLLIIGLLIAAFVAIAVGMHRSPAPYGLAENGAIVSSRDGDIYAIDPATLAATLVVGGGTFDFAPTYSRDGSKFLFMRSAGPMPTSGPPMLSLMVANADASGVRSLSDPVTELSWFDWSPNGSQIAYIHDFGTLTVVNVDGSGSRTLDIGQPAHFATWLPPDGAEILVRGEHYTAADPAPGIFAVRADGQGFRRVTNGQPKDQDDYMRPTVSPDGLTISFARFFGGTSSIHMLDVRTGAERPLPGPAGIGQGGGATFSPDGKRVAYSRIYRDGAVQVVVAPADGTTEGTALGPRMSLPSGEEPGVWIAFTPDGSAVIAGFGTDLDRTIYRIPVDGSPETPLGKGGFGFLDVQRR
jgi:Tol biopolymer transport system component